ISADGRQASYILREEVASASVPDAAKKNLGVKIASTERNGVYVIDLETRETVKIQTTGSLLDDLHLLADGRHLVYRNVGSLYLYDLEASSDHNDLVTGGGVTDVAMSLNGSHLAYVSDEWIHVADVTVDGAELPVWPDGAAISLLHSDET